MPLRCSLLLLCSCLVLPSWQFRLVDTVNVTNWMNNMYLMEKQANFGFTHWLGLNDALNGNHLGDGKKFMTLRPDSTNMVNGGERGRRSVAVQSRAGLSSGVIVVDVAHVPEPACGMDASLYLYDGRTAEEGPVRIILSELIGWDPSNTMNYGDGLKHGLARIHKRSGNDSFAAHANKNGGVIFVTQWSVDDVRIWDFQEGEIPKYFPSRGVVPAPEIDTAQFGKGNWNPIDSKVAIRNGPPLKFTAEVSFCEPNVMNQWDSVTPLNPYLEGFPNRCQPTGQTCQQMVSNRPFDYKDAFWDINSISFYT